ncbi:MAG TPA: hypothetical protein VIF15_21940, partial [Polyangiaceae bacterium]
MRCLASFPLALLFLGCSATSSGHAACSGCDCNTTVETCPSQCFPTYTDQPDGGVAFSCGSAAPPDPGVF